MLFIFLATLLSSSHAALEAKWLGVSGISVTDGETTVLFDPVTTKANMFHWILNSVMNPDKEEVKAALKRWNISKADGILISHTHFDHASDVGRVAELTGATVYGGESLKRVATFQYPAVNFKYVKNKEPIQVGKFKVTSFLRGHAPIIHLLNWHFLQGEVPKDFKGNFYDYYDGDAWGFYIEHPEGNVLIDQGSHYNDYYKELAGKVTAFFMGVANKKSLESLVNENIGTIKPKIVIPLHFDIFFLPFEAPASWHMPGTNVEAVKEKTESTFKEIKFHIPTIGEAIAL
ncbi:MAG: MBL fold metallo-hydrolase [Bacteriovoracaceae bacterium]|nr:MBL fold metallo-hydrolase [Bacteriovoracaceae bacterium]